MSREIGPGGKPNQNSGTSGEAGHFLKHIVAYTSVAVVAIGGAVGYGIYEHNQGGDEPAPTPPPQEATKLPGKTFEQILNDTQEVKRESPAVLANYDLARVITGDYASGETTLEQITVTAEGCRTSSGSVLPSQTISRVIFRNRSDESLRYTTAFLTPEHIEKTEDYRTKFRENRVESGFVTRSAKPFSATATNQIYAQLTGPICGNEGTGETLINPEITQHAIRIDDATYDNRKPYEDSNQIDIEAFQKSLLELVLAGVIIGGGYLTGRMLFDRRRNKPAPEEHAKNDEPTEF